MKTFAKSFTQQEALPAAAIEAANQLMQSGRLHRYNSEHGEPSETDLLELEFADYMGVPYCLACSSCGYALQLAMRSVGVKQGDQVLTNAFTLAPVPGSIHNCGAIPVLVDVADDYCIDLEDLAKKAESSDARYFVLSHMRGHIADMDRIMSLCKKFQLILIEDCAHTMGASWNGVKSGAFGAVACFSTQTYKHLNSGEGGLLISRDDQTMARAIMYSGSYMLFNQHRAAPPVSVFDEIKFDTPNYSGRMDNLRAAILRPQLALLDQQCERWNLRYRILEGVIRQCESITMPIRPSAEQFVASSIQFSLPDFSQNQILAVIAQCAERGVALKWFGDVDPKGYTSRYDSWHYIETAQQLEKTQNVLACLLDMRIPLTFTEQDCELIGEIIIDVVSITADSKGHR